jgi:hypothetical protein
VALALRPEEREQAAQQAAASAGGLELDQELYPPAGSRTAFLSAKVATAGAGEVSPAGLSLQLARGEVAVFRQLTMFAKDPDDTTDATWRITVNGVTVPGLEALTMIFRTASSLATSLDTLRVPVPDGGVVAVVINNRDGLPRVYGAQLVGWAMKRKNVTSTPASPAAA